MKETLRTLVQQSNDLMMQLAESGGELTPELESQLANVELALPEKVDSYAHLIDRLDVEIETWKQKADFYSAIAKSCKNVKERLKENIKFAMQEMTVSEIKGNDVRFKLSSSKPSLQIDESLIDPLYTSQVTTTVIDKKRIEEDLKAGVPVAGARLIENVSLRTYANRRE